MFVSFAYLMRFRHVLNALEGYLRRPRPGSTPLSITSLTTRHSLLLTLDLSQTDRHTDRHSNTPS